MPTEYLKLQELFIQYILLVKAAVGIEVHQTISGGSFASVALPPGTADGAVTDIGDIIVHQLFP